MHAMMAAAFHPCMALEENEAKALAMALANVQHHYPNVRLISEKHAAVLGLIMCGSRIYGKRAMILAGMMEMQTEPARAKPRVMKEPGSNVHRPEKFNPPPAPAPEPPPSPETDPLAALSAQGLAPPPEPEPWGFTPPSDTKQ